MVTLYFKHDRAGDTAPLIATLSVEGSYGSQGADGLGGAYNFPLGQIDAGGYLREDSGQSFMIAAARPGIDPIPPVHWLSVFRDDVRILSVSFVPVLLNADDTIFSINDALTRALPKAVLAEGDVIYLPGPPGQPGAPGEPGPAGPMPTKEQMLDQLAGSIDWTHFTGTFSGELNAIKDAQTDLNTRYETLTDTELLYSQMLDAKAIALAARDDANAAALAAEGYSAQINDYVLIANNKAQESQNAAEASASSAQLALTHVTNAEAASTAASESAVRAESAFVASQILIPNGDFSQGFTNWATSGAGPTADLVEPVEDIGMSWLIGSAYDGGRALMLLGDRTLYMKRPLPVTLGRTYRVSARWRGSSTSLAIGFICLDENLVPVSGSPVLASSVSGPQMGPMTTTTVDITAPGGSGLTMPAGTVFVRPMFSASISDEAFFDSLNVEDVTESKRAAGSATASAASAELALTRAGEASSSAQAANQSKLDAQAARTEAQNSAAAAVESAGFASGYADDARVSAEASEASYVTARAAMNLTATAMNKSFKQGWLGWSLHPNSGQEGWDNPPYHFLANSTVGDYGDGGAIRFQGSGAVYGLARFAVTGLTHIKLRGRFVVHIGARTGDNKGQFYLGLGLYDAAGEHVTNYYARVEYLGVGVHPIWEVDVPMSSVLALDPAIVSVTPMALLNFVNGSGAQATGLADVDILEMVDTTQATAAAGSASQASTHAYNAGQSASAANTSAVNASTKAGEASGSAGQAATSAETAGGHAASALSWMNAAAKLSGSFTSQLYATNSTSPAISNSVYTSGPTEGNKFTTTPMVNPGDISHVTYNIPAAQRIAATAGNVRCFLPSGTPIVNGALYLIMENGKVKYGQPVIPLTSYPRDQWISVLYDFKTYTEGDAVIGVDKISQARFYFGSATSTVYANPYFIRVDSIALGTMDAVSISSKAEVEALATDLRSQINLRAEYARSPKVASEGRLARRLKWLEGTLLTNNASGTGGTARHAEYVGYTVAAGTADPWFSSENFGTNVNPNDAQKIVLELNWTGAPFDVTSARLHYANSSHPWSSGHYIDAVSPESPLSTALRIPQNVWFTLEFNTNKFTSNLADYLSSLIYAYRIDFELPAGSSIPAGTLYIRNADLYNLTDNKPALSKSEFTLFSDAYNAEATIKVQAGNVIAGITTRADAGLGSHVGVRADRFFVTNDTYANGQNPFVIEGGLVKINGSLVATGSIQGSSIAAGTVNLINNVSQSKNLDRWGTVRGYLAQESASIFGSGTTDSGLLHILRLYTPGNPDYSQSNCETSSNSFKIDPRKTYEFSVTVQPQYFSSTTMLYFGTAALDNLSNPVKLRVYDIGAGVFKPDGWWMERNPYFYEAYATGGVKHMRGFMVPWNTDPATIPKDTGCHYAYFMPPEAYYSYFRFLAYYNSSATCVDLANMTVVERGSFTLIDGGSITTGTIDASKATITNINASNITTGLLQAERLDIRAKNLVVDPNASGDARGWTFDVSSWVALGWSPAHRGITQQTAGTTGAYSDWFTVSPNKGYMFSVVSVIDGGYAAGTRYFGLNVFDYTGAEVALDIYDAATRTYQGTDGNPYFWWGQGSNVMTPRIGLLLPFGTDPKTVPLPKNVTYFFVMPRNAVSARMRFLNYENGGTMVRAWWLSPSVTEITGNVSIVGDNIRAGTLDASIVNVTNLNAGNITTGTLSADRIYGGTINGNVVTVTNLNAANIKAGKLVSYYNPNTYIDLDAGTMKIGNSSKYLEWNGSNLIMTGQVVTGANLSTSGKVSVDHKTDGTYNIAVGGTADFNFATSGNVGLLFVMAWLQAGTSPGTFTVTTPNYVSGGITSQSLVYLNTGTYTVNAPRQTFVIPVPTTPSGNSPIRITCQGAAITLANVSLISFSGGTIASAFSQVVPGPGAQ